MDCNLVPADMGQKSNYDLLLGGRPRPSRKRGGRNQKLRPRHKTRDKAMRCVQLCFSFNIHKDKDKDGDNNKDKDKTRDKAMRCEQLGSLRITSFHNCNYICRSRMYFRNYICLKCQQKNSRYRPLQYMFFKLLQSGLQEDPPKHNQAILWGSAKHNSCYEKKYAGD